MSFEIKQPQCEEEFKRYYHFRWQQLRAPWHQPEGSEVDALEDQCFHLMAVANNKRIVAVARLQFNSDTEAQIRYMAVAPSHERRGIGRQLVNKLEAHAKASEGKTIILDAREAAVPFYEKLGYTVVEKSYLLFNEIQHFQMRKTL